MSSCSMVKHILKTDDTDKLSCNDEECNQIKVDATQPGLFSYILQVIGGPGNFLKSQLRKITICDNFATSTIQFIKKQTAFIDDKDILFKVPKFPNAICSDVKYEFKEKDCETPSSAFENLDDLFM